MVKRLLYIFLLLLSYTSLSYAQTYGNEWIDYSQTYYSFKLVNSGVYKLDYTALNASGVPLTTFGTSNIQVFGREKEVPLYVVDGGDNAMDPGDYILFYASRNDGWLDSTIYQDPDLIGNPEYSLFNDTIQYFFTWNNSTTNLRYEVETDVDFSSYTPSNYILQKLESNYHSYYNLGGDRTSLATSSLYKGGEGFGLAPVNGVGNYTLALTALTYSPYTGPDAPLIIFEGKSTTNSDADFTGTGNHHLRWNIGSSNLLLYDGVTTGYQYINVNKTFSITELSNGSTPLNWTIVDDQGAVTDYQALNYWALTYPKTPTLDGGYSGKFSVPNNLTQSKIRLDFTNLTVSNPLVFVHGDIPRKVSLTANGSAYSILIPNNSTSANQEVVIQDFTSAIAVPTFNLVNGTGFFTDFSLADPDSVLLMIYHPSLEVQSNAYQMYRESIAGGSYNTLMANVNELYLQFGGGIDKHINGIRRFANYIYNLATVKPVGLFLMGKGISIADNGYPAGSPGMRVNTASYAASLIPSFGEPSSDLAITASLDTTWAPLIPTGRIAVKTNQELLDYLNKIVQYEAQQDSNTVYNSSTKDWQKQILHFGGGLNASQQSTFQSYLNAMENTIEGANFGGQVQRIYKNSSLPFDPTVLSGVTTRIQEGVSLMTFFGHASANGFDINIDQPSEWGNVGKYPVVIGNSCYTGNMYANTATPTITEKFINVQNGGAIAFLGAPKDGLDQPLSLYSNELYNQFSVTNYGKPISYQIKKAIEQLQLSGFSNLMVQATCEQMNLNGDPMLRLNWHAKPEIELVSEGISFSPDDLDLTVDSIEVSIILTNLGKSITDTFDLEITRNFPLNQVDSIYTIKIPKLDYKDTIYFSMPLQPNVGVGINNFTITADIPNFHNEQYDEIYNNQVNTALFIDIDGIMPVIPHDFAVVPDDSVTVVASTINPIADYASYRFELDTTDLFDSPMHRYVIVTGFGGVKQVNPSEWKLVSNNQNAPLLCTDSTVYFWRVALDSFPYDWRERSFQYIPNKTGWGQDHFFQFKKNDFTSIDYNRDDRLKYFLPAPTDTLKSIVSPGMGICKFYMNGNYIDGIHCTVYPELCVAIFEPNSHANWRTRFLPTGANLNNNFGNQNDNNNCMNRPMAHFNYPQISTQYLDDFEGLINLVPDGYYILIYTTFKADYAAWDIYKPGLYSVFQNLGSTVIDTGLPNLPFSFFCKKGDPSTVVEVHAQNTTEVINLYAPLHKQYLYGTESATMIGPAAKWGNVYWKQDSLEGPSFDSTELHIKAYDIYKSFQYQIDTSFTSNDSILDLNTLIDASLYPYIQLSADLVDTIGMTPAQIDRWHVLYELLPEAAIDGTSEYSWIPDKDTLDEGENVKFAVDVKNIFSIDMDSLLINYWIEDANQTIHPIPYARQSPLLVGDVIRDTIEFSTLGLAGINSLWMEVNPYVNGSLYITDQAEQEHFNNILQVPFYVNRDDVNPILDVTFDGKHILNGDIISPKSEIFITLKDDNPLLVMDSDLDTALFGIYITDPLGVQRKIPFVDANGNTVMSWIPADGQNKRFKIVYPAVFTMDGVYALLVQGSDRSGNISGELQYRVTFEIISESSITYLMNYPNPFSTSTRFVFTLTGSEVPENIIIQIMTVTGKVVREITESELGPIYIGRNITEFEWNGTDEFGDPLANGVYLYRVKAQINGEDIKHRSSGADTHFTKDFGKMYILR